MKHEYDLARDAAHGLAETETNGVLVNREGRSKGITGEALFSGPEAYARRYASEELLDHWTRHPRPSLASFEAQWIHERVVVWQ